ncbi:MAG: type II toxin-antitoxin system RelE/ParE family toxin [Acidimicrobiales bacterium]
MTPDPYEVTWASSALRSLDRLPEKVAAACVAFVYGGLAENPHLLGRALRFDLEGKHGARRNDFRVIYAIDHRNDVYRPR